MRADLSSCSVPSAKTKTISLHPADDLSGSPFLSVFLKVTILQVPSSALVKRVGNLDFIEVSPFFVIGIIGYSWLHFLSVRECFFIGICPLIHRISREFIIFFRCGKIFMSCKYSDFLIC